MASIRKKLTLSCLSLVGTFVLLELGLRVVGYDPFGERMRSGRQEPGELLAEGFLVESEHPDLVYELAPGGRAHAWGADVELNAHGFRDREFAPTKPAGTRRIVALGDSVTFGTRLGVDVLWPKVLERSLRAAGREVEVLNLGIVGYDVHEEVVFLERRGLAFEPDLVIVAFHVNDLGYASPTRSYIERLKSYGSPLYRLRTLQLVRSQLDRIQMAREHERRDDDAVFVEENRARIADLSGDHELLARLEALRPELDALELPSGLHRYLQWYGSEPRVGRLRFALERLAGLAEEHGFEVLVFQVPWLGDSGVEATYDHGYALVRDEVERAGLHWLDPTAATRAAGHKELRITTGDYGHPNERGHAILAAEVERALGELAY